LLCSRANKLEEVEGDYDLPPFRVVSLMELVSMSTKDGLEKMSNGHLSQ
jgi:hypothetical protein